MLVFATLQLIVLAGAADSLMVNGWVVRISILPVTFLLNVKSLKPLATVRRKEAALLS